MTPDRRIVSRWAFLTVALLAVPMVILLVVTIGTKADTGDIKAAQDQAQEAADAAVRNGAVSACQGRYARAAAVHQSTAARLDQHAETLFAEAIELSAADAPDDVLVDKLAEYAEATRAAEDATDLLDEINRRGLGVTSLATQNVTSPFRCPAIPRRLQVSEIDPTDPDRPGP